MSDFRPSAVIFDLDGTLIDSLPGIAYSVRAAFAACGLPYPAVDLRSMIGPPIRTILSNMANTNEPDVLALLENEFRTSYDTVGWTKSRWYSGAEALIERLHEAGLRLFLVTNKPRHITLRTLTIANVLHLFEQIVTRDLRSPHFESKTAMIAFLIESCALSPAACLLVGDTEEDANAAAQCSVQFAYVTHGYGNIGSDSRSLVHLKLDKFSQLPQWIGLEFAHD